MKEVLCHVTTMHADRDRLSSIEQGDQRFTTEWGYAYPQVKGYADFRSPLTL